MLQEILHTLTVGTARASGQRRRVVANWGHRGIERVAANDLVKMYTRGLSRLDERINTVDGKTIALEAHHSGLRKLARHEA